MILFQQCLFFMISFLGSDLGNNRKRQVEGRNKEAKPDPQKHLTYYLKIYLRKYAYKQHLLFTFSGARARVKSSVRDCFIKNTK